MNRFEQQEMKKRLPIIAHLLGNKDCDNISIKEIDINLLARTPTYSGATGSHVGIDSNEEIHFVLVDGSPGTKRFVINAVKTAGHVRHNEAHQDDESWAGETIAEAIDRQGIADKVQSIVIERAGYTIRNHHSVGGHSLTIYLPKTGTQIKDYLSELETAAREKAEECLADLQA